MGASCARIPSVAAGLSAGVVRLVIRKAGARALGLGVGWAWGLLCLGAIGGRVDLEPIDVEPAGFQGCPQSREVLVQKLAGLLGRGLETSLHPAVVHLNADLEVPELLRLEAERNGATVPLQCRGQALAELGDELVGVGRSRRRLMLRGGRTG